MPSTTKARKPKLPAAPPRKRDWKVRQVYHVYQCGSRHQRIFNGPADLVTYLSRLDRLARRYRVRLHAFNLMSHYVHFLLEPLTKWGISHLMQHLQSFFARHRHQALHLTGHLWRNHFHAKPVKTAAQYRATLLYIEQDPALAGTAPRAHRYDYSSAPAHTANQVLYQVRHRGQSAHVHLYLTRWRREFPQHANWPAILRTPRDPAFAQQIAEIERILGSDRLRRPPSRPLSALAPPAPTPPPRAHPATSHGWTRQ